MVRLLLQLAWTRSHPPERENKQCTDADTRTSTPTPAHTHRKAPNLAPSFFSLSLFYHIYCTPLHSIPSSLSLLCFPRILPWVLEFSMSPSQVHSHAHGHTNLNAFALQELYATKSSLSRSNSYSAVSSPPPPTSADEVLERDTFKLVLLSTSALFVIYHVPLLAFSTGRSLSR